MCVYLYSIAISTEPLWEIGLQTYNYLFNIHRFQKLIYLHLFTELFNEDLSSITLTNTTVLNRDLHKRIL